jgi:nucleoside-diphosphate kinase
MIEQTLIIFKPHAIKRSVVGEILSRFEKVGLKIVGIKMLNPTKEHLYTHYEDIGKVISRRGQHTFDVLLEMMQEGPVIAMVLEGVEAASLVRKMVGATEPKSALPGTIRGDFAHMSFAHADKNSADVYNLIHASGDADEAKLEIKHWFSDSEIFDYEAVHEASTQGKKK